MSELATRLIPRQGAMYEIYREGGGKVPETLKGRYNRRTTALKAIADYSEGLKEKEKNKRSYHRSRKNAKAKEQSGD